MNLLDRISVDPTVRFGRLCVRGTRITVGDVLAHLAGGMSKDQLLTDFPSRVKTSELVWRTRLNASGGLSAFRRPEAARLLLRQHRTSIQLFTEQDEATFLVLGQ